MIQVVPEAIREKYFPGLQSLGILRLDLPDPIAGGNKQYKLKYHLEAFRNSGRKNILSFGGAFSNHIAALAYAGKENDVRTIGVIRGEELNGASNRVLAFAAQCGMQLNFVSREEYRNRYEANHQEELAQRYDAYVVPEGGGGEAGIRGCREILNADTQHFHQIFIASGTGTTAEGLRQSAPAHQIITAIDVVQKINTESLGGYGKTSSALEIFLREMREELNLPLDRVYTGKTLFALHQRTRTGLVNGSVLFVHTGGYAFESEQN